MTEVQVPPEAAREAVAGILRSRSFIGAERRKKLLEYLVNETLAGRSSALKEFSIGVEVYARDPAIYDPRLDPVVRVDIGRLRTKLKEYYEAEGREDAIRIELPKGSYAVLFHARATSAAVPVEQAGTPAVALLPPAAILPRPTRRPHFLAASVVVLVALLALAGFVLYRWVRPPAGLRSVAVLPFLDLSANHQGEYFTDGLTDELTGALAHLEGLRVVARTSAYQFKGKGEDVRTIGRVLHVDALVEGSVQRSEGRVRVTVQLERASDGYHLWASTFDESTNDLFQVEDEVSRAIAGALRVRLSGQNLPSRQTTNPEAHRLYLQARYLWNKRSIASLQQALQLLNDAIEKDQGYALAYAAKADCYAVLGVNEEAAPQEAMPNAIAAARQALALDDSIGEAHATLAYAKFFYEHDPRGAESEFRRALDLNPNYATAYHWYGNTLTSLRRFDEGRSQLEHARELDPLSAVVQVALSNGDYYARNYVRSREEARQALKIEPDFWMAHSILGAPADSQGRFDEALAEAKKAYALSDDLDQLSNLGTLYGISGKRAEALRVASELQSKAKQRYVSAMFLADIYASVKDRERAFAMLGEAEKQHAIGLMALAVDPAFDPFRREPEFQNLLKRLNLPN